MATLEELLAQSLALNNEKAEIEKKRTEVANKQLELNNLIAEAKKAKELEKIQLITITKVQNGTVTIDTNGTPRIDVLDILRNTPSRFYDVVLQKNRIDIRYWNQFFESLQKCPNVEIVYAEKNKEALENYFSEKMWRISKSDKYIVIKNADRNIDLHKLDKIPSRMWNTVVKATVVPFSEGWRVIQVLPINEDTEYTPEVLELIEKQVEQRKKMDEVALNNNAEIPNPFINGMELKPFQKAGVFFAMTALGIEMPVMKEKKPEPKPW